MREKALGLSARRVAIRSWGAVPVQVPRGRTQAAMARTKGWAGGGAARAAAISGKASVG